MFHDTLLSKDRPVRENAGGSVFTRRSVNMKSTRCLSTKALMALCLFTMSLLTVMSLYLALRCMATNYIDGFIIKQEQLTFRESSSDLEGLWEKGNEISPLWQPIVDETDLFWKLLPDRLLQDTYILKYTELRERNLLREYPVQLPCKDKKRPAVPCNDTDCRKSLSRDLHTSIHSLLSATRKARMKLVNPLDTVTADLLNSHVTIVTAASANQYLEIQAMIETLHQYVFPKFRNISLYLYDIGMLKSQVEKIEKDCRCKIVKFPFDSLPAQIRNISCHSWKPLIVHAHLPKTNMLIWVDATTMFSSSPSDEFFEEVTKEGFLTSFSKSDIRSVAQTTASAMFRFFDVEACSVAHFQELETSFMAFHNQPFTKDIIVESWASCALDPDCMCPAGALSMNQCDNEPRHYSKCHKFDQSALSLIMLKLFQNDYTTFTFNHSDYAVKKVFNV